MEDLTKAEMEGREQAMHGKGFLQTGVLSKIKPANIFSFILLFSILALTALKSVIPGFSKARLRNFGMTIGTRDSRKIVGR